MDIINALVLAEDPYAISRLMGRVVGGLIILIIVIVIFKKVAGKGK